MSEAFEVGPTTNGVGGDIVWEASIVSVGDRTVRVLLERDDSGLLWMTTIYPDLITAGNNSSISVNVTHKDIDRLWHAVVDETIAGRWPGHNTDGSLRHE